ncbi:MAG: hypothetical protein ABL890_03620 [Candidatus Peribacteraceae bacterium]
MEKLSVPKAALALQVIDRLDRLSRTCFSCSIPIAKEEFTVLQWPDLFVRIGGVIESIRRCVRNLPEWKAEILDPLEDLRSESDAYDTEVAKGMEKWKKKGKLLEYLCAVQKSPLITTPQKIHGISNRLHEAARSLYEQSKPEVKL